LWNFIKQEICKDYGGNTYSIDIKSFENTKELIPLRIVSKNFGGKTISISHGWPLSSKLDI
jgi:hypothetical protein